MGLPEVSDLAESAPVTGGRHNRGVTDPERLLHVAEDAGRIVGYARASRWTPPADAPPNAAPSGWYLLGLVVTPEYRRRGIGRALTVARLNAIAARASEVWYFVNARNRSSLDLHATLGFAEVTRDFWFPGLTFDGGEGILARARTERWELGAGPRT